MSILFGCTTSDIKQAAISLMAGNLIAFPTETVYGLGADAQNQSAVSRVYKVKSRPTNHPLIVHISSINKLHFWAEHIPDYAIKLASLYWPGPMTLVLPRSAIAPDFITGGQSNVALRVPNHLVALALIEEFEKLGGNGVAAPSANKFSALSPTSSQAVLDELGENLLPTDLILDGGKCDVGLESTIIDCTNDQPIILRPGAVNQQMVDQLISTNNSAPRNTSDKKKEPIRVSGSLKSHYAPKAKILIGNVATPGQGLIALHDYPTPVGVVRLANPKDDVEFAQNLYGALRTGDKLNIQYICVILPKSGPMLAALEDRLGKAAME